MKLAERGDIEGWHELAAEVESLFGPMVGEPSFERALRKNVDRGTAWCIRDPDRLGALLGGMFLREREAHAEVGWFAVAARARRRGIGTTLLQAGLRTLDPSLPVRVITFGADHPGGAAACAFYERMGFLPGEAAPEGPEGGSRLVFVLPPRSR